MKISHAFDSANIFSVLFISLWCLCVCYILYVQYTVGPCCAGMPVPLYTIAASVQSFSPMFANTECVGLEQQHFTVHVARHWVCMVFELHVKIETECFY